MDWHTVWSALTPLLEELVDDPARLAGVDTVGVDEHVWHHQPRPGKGPKERTGIVDLTRHDGRPRARLLNLVLGRSGKVYADWLRSRGTAFTTEITTATLDPFRGYGNAIRDELDDAVADLDAFHVVKVGLQAMEEVRRRVQQELLGHRGRKHDPLYKIRNALRAGTDNLTARQIERIEAGLQAGDPTFEVTVGGALLPAAEIGVRRDEPGRRPPDRRVGGRFLLFLPDPRDRQTRPHAHRVAAPVPGLFTTERANNGGTEAVNGIIELHRWIARGFRNHANYRVRMILAAGKLTHHPNLR